MNRARAGKRDSRRIRTRCKKREECKEPGGGGGGKEEEREKERRRGGGEEEEGKTVVLTRVGAAISEYEHVYQRGGLRSVGHVERACVLARSTLPAASLPLSSLSLSIRPCPVHRFHPFTLPCSSLPSSLVRPPAERGIQPIILGRPRPPRSHSPPLRPFHVQLHPRSPAPRLPAHPLARSLVRPSLGASDTKARQYLGQACFAPREVSWAAFARANQKAS